MTEQKNYGEMTVKEKSDFWMGRGNEIIMKRHESHDDEHWFWRQSFREVVEFGSMLVLLLALSLDLAKTIITWLVVFL